MNLWICTEERPKLKVLELIVQRFLADSKWCAFVDNLRILPVVEDSKFSFDYEIIGVKCNQIQKIFLEIVSGASSFVDYLVFFQEHKPTQNDIPLYLIEETKTDDSESRNTGVYQRITKFVYAHFFYPNSQKIMLYNLKVLQKEKPTQTSIFGTRILRTLGVEILGKSFKDDDGILKPFANIKELIEFKTKMRKAPKGNVPIEIIESSENKIQVSGRLLKSGRLAHDPNIGAISGIASTLRKLGFNGEIEIISHGLNQAQVGTKNKFIQIANLLNLSLAGLTIPKIEIQNIGVCKKAYWHYEQEGEKLATIFIHLLIENFSSGKAIFENHAGCEKGYFITSDNQYIALQKYQDREIYKAGNKNAIVFIPDLILLDPENLEIINIEGKTYENRHKGIEELKNYDFIENEYIKKHYPTYKIVRSVVLYGSCESKIIEIEIGFLLNSKGEMVLGIKAPQIFIFSLKNLLDFWKKQ
ncbi:hypothetical protein OQH60_06000 [Campylobacter sp. MIT 21-1685]|uniref:hypothetical protein n=1 Tax=unclassified Campylobacter TaxID=2593542 RepID=UPI00224A63DE|nr:MULTISPECIES: hypothetical protein [unclassified Campylobacter]MCX2683377.1 hypothetical protein [Campylobacter sp. MIT 21-1684]MCX2751696.1 hypothetical protein [Campylobacter sp. MIT 21-1682]MCX2807898.1 hypothetical protein [Campylobacter sp. MIT 21-1685]